MTHTRRIIAAVVVFLGLGYISSLASVAVCEVAAARRIASDEGREFFVLSDDPSVRPNYSGSQRILKRAGINVRQCQRTADQFDCFPWAGVAHGDVVGPFLVDVRWGFVLVPTSGAGTRTTYFVLFGVVFGIRDSPEWVT